MVECCVEQESETDIVEPEKKALLDEQFLTLPIREKSGRVCHMFTVSVYKGSLGTE